MNKRQIAEEELKRALLMMKYDTRKTLTENVEGVMGLSEQPDSKMPFQSEKFGYVQGKPETVQPSIQKQQETLANTDTQTTENNPKTNVNTTTKNVNMWDYVGSNSPEINVNLGVTESEIENFKSKGWSEVQLDEINRDVSDDEGLVDSLDATTMGYLGDNMEDDDMLMASSIISKYKLSYVRWNDKYYPAMEAVRAKYSEDESGDSLRADIWDPPGTNTSDVQKFSKDTAAIYDNSYKNWCDILNSLVLKTDTDDSKKNDDNKKTVYTGGGSYTACTGTYTQGCKSQTIKKVQGCLGGLVPDGKFGPKTQKALAAKGFASGFTDADVDKICKVQASPEPEVELPTPENNIDSLN